MGMGAHLVATLLYKSRRIAGSIRSGSLVFFNDFFRPHYGTGADSVFTEMITGVSPGW